MSTALYRRYRPDSFADVIGQEHVTTPLMAALAKNRVNHAYLFSGPRGCGKTTSARILARCLNCEQGPTENPCGECASCRDLATGGPGSLDVIEIDAASHGGVDDARDLRERATFAPTRDRYKIFIIDEAHMVTSAGFNALLKIVEEPPEHIKFVFATTEPDKVIGTIRSRTHHYPFRLVPPETLMEYLERLCQQENVPVAPGVLSLVLRAGGGSVRDTLSVLDQLMAGAGPEGLNYELAVSLLGYTHASLLDDVVDALAAQDAATVFAAVDRVIQTGHDPRRFVEDLLERLRDLIIVKAMPDAAAQILRGVPADQLARMQQQAAILGQAELSRAADVTNQALTEMTGATSPRLHLELLCARLLLPTSDAGERGIGARVDRIERRLTYGGSEPLTDGAPAGASGHDGGASAGAPGAESAGVGGAAHAGGATGAAAVREALRAAKAKQEPAAAVPEPVNEPAQPEPTQQDPVQQEPVQPEPIQPEPATPDAPAQPEPAAKQEEAPAAQAPTPQDAGASNTEQPAAAAPTASDEAAPKAAFPKTAEELAARLPQRSEPRQETEPTADWGGAWTVPDADALGSRAVEPEPTSPETPQPKPAAQQPAQAQQPAPTQQPSAPEQGQPSVPQPQQESAPAQPQPSQPQEQQPAPAQPEAAPSGAPASGGAGSIEMFRRAWPEVLEVIKNERKVVWMNLQQNASLAGFDGRTLALGFAHPGAMANFQRLNDNVALVQWAINQVLGVQVGIDVVAGSSADAGGSGPKADRRSQPASAGSAPTRSAAPRPNQGVVPRPEAASRPAPQPFQPAPQRQEHYERPEPPQWTEFPPADAPSATSASEADTQSEPEQPTQGQPAQSQSAQGQSTQDQSTTAVVPVPTPAPAEQPSAETAATEPSFEGDRASAVSPVEAAGPKGHSSHSAISAASAHSAASAPSAPSAASAGSAESATSTNSAPSAQSAAPAPAEAPAQAEASAAPSPAPHSAAPSNSYPEPDDGWIPPEEPPEYDEPYDPYEAGSVPSPSASQGPPQQPRAATAASAPSATAGSTATAASASSAASAAAAAPAPTIPPPPAGPTPPPPSWAGSALPPGMRQQASEKPAAPAPEQRDPAKKLSRYQQLLAQAEAENGGPPAGGWPGSNTPQPGGATSPSAAKPAGSSANDGAAAGNAPGAPGQQPGQPTPRQPSAPGRTTASDTAQGTTAQAPANEAQGGWGNADSAGTAQGQTGNPAPAAPTGGNQSGPAGAGRGPGAPGSGAGAVNSSYGAVDDADFVPSDDDIAIEDSTVIGRAAIERILNGRLIEERNNDGTPINQP